MKLFITLALCGITSQAFAFEVVNYGHVYKQAERIELSSNYACNHWIECYGIKLNINRHSTNLTYKGITANISLHNVSINYKLNY